MNRYPDSQPEKRAHSQHRLIFLSQKWIASRLSRISNISTERNSSWTILGDELSRNVRCNANSIAIMAQNMNIHNIYAIFARYFRRARMRDFANAYQIDASTKIIDVGGEEYNWTLIEAQPKLLLVNVYGTEWDRGNISYRVGDGTKLPYESKS